MTLPSPPNEAVIRAALIDLITNDIGVQAWLAGGNPGSETYDLDIAEYNMFEVPQEELSVRIQVLSVAPSGEDRFDRCLEFFCRITIWLFFFSAGSSLAHSYLGAIEEAIQDTMKHTVTFQGKSVVLHDIIFAGRVTQVPSAQRWAIPSTFTFMCRYY